MRFLQGRARFTLMFLQGGDEIDLQRHVPFAPLPGGFTNAEELRVISTSDQQVRCRLLEDNTGVLLAETAIEHDQVRANDVLLVAKGALTLAVEISR